MAARGRGGLISSMSSTLKLKMSRVMFRKTLTRGLIRFNLRSASAWCVMRLKHNPLETTEPLVCILARYSSGVSDRPSCICRHCDGGLEFVSIHFVSVTSVMAAVRSFGGGQMAGRELPAIRTVLPLRGTPACFVASIQLRWPFP
jgi:hypothetical protein